MVRVRKVLSVPQMAVALTVGMVSGIYIYRSPLQQYNIDTMPPDSKEEPSHEPSTRKPREKQASADPSSDVQGVSEKQR